MDNERGIENSLVVEGEENIIDHGLELLCRRSRRMLWLVVRDGRRVVLKGLTEDRRTHPEDIAALRKEYLLGVRLEERGIVRVYGFEEHPQVGPVIVMEYIDGIPLNDYLSSHGAEGSRFPKLSERRKIAFEIAHAITSMHKAGISHRDLKPDNILISTKDSTPKIIDFGNGDAEDFVIYKNSLGTELYGAPEQQPCSESGKPSDVYSFGKIMDQLLPERRFKRLRKACQAADPSLRPDMDYVTRYLTPSQSKHYILAIVAGMVAVSLVIIWIAFSYRESESNRISQQVKETYVKEDEIGKTTTGETTIDTVLTSAQRPVDISKERVSPKEMIKQPAIDDRISTNSTTIIAVVSLDRLLQKYINLSDKITARYGKLPYDDDPYGDNNRRRLKRVEEYNKLAADMDEELKIGGIGSASRSNAYHTLWTHIILETNEIDGVNKSVKEYMESHGSAEAAE